MNVEDPSTRRLFLVVAFASTTLGCSTSQPNVSSEDSGAADADLTADSGGIDPTADSAAVLPANVKTVVKKLASAPSRIVSDGTSLYWIAKGDQDLYAISVNGASTPTTLATDVTAYNFLAADGASVYFLSNHDVYRVAKAGGDKANLTNIGNVGAAALRPDQLLWAAGKNTSWFLYATLLADGTSQPVKNGLLVSDDPVSMAASSLNAFVATNTKLERVPFTTLAGATNVSLPELTTLTKPYLEGDVDSAYLGLIKIPDVGDATALSEIRANAVAVDTNDIYFSNGIIQKISKQGGTPVVLAPEAATAMAVDATAVYWATSTGSIRRLEK